MPLPYAIQSSIRLQRTGLQVPKLAKILYLALCLNKLWVVATFISVAKCCALLSGDVIVEACLKQHTRGPGPDPYIAISITMLSSIG